MKYKDKYFSILGDSISTFEGVSVPKNCEFYTLPNKITAGVTKVSDTWWGGVIDSLGGKLLVNNSISGSTVCYSPAYEYESYGCSDSRTANLHDENIYPDVIIVYLGTNDFGMDKEIYSQDKSNLTVFENAYKTMLGKLKTNYKTAEIWCVSLCACAYFITYKVNNCGKNLTDYNSVIKSLCENLNCKFIDIYSESTPYATMDEIHPNLSGMQLIKNRILNKIV